MQVINTVETSDSETFIYWCEKTDDECTIDKLSNDDKRIYELLKHKYDVKVFNAVIMHDDIEDYDRWICNMCGDEIQFIEFFSDSATCNNYNKRYSHYENRERDMDICTKCITTDLGSEFIVENDLKITSIPHWLVYTAPPIYRFVPIFDGMSLEDMYTRYDKEKTNDMFWLNKLTNSGILALNSGWCTDTGLEPYNFTNKYTALLIQRQKNL